MANTEAIGEPCPGCDNPTDDLGWCASCDRGRRLRAARWADLLLDRDGCEELPVEPSDQAGFAADPLNWPGYPEALAEAPGDEAVRSWAGAIDGRGCVLIAFDFAHLGGSMGSGVTARVVEAFRTATRRRLPVVTVTATGGARMQEGMVSLLGMGKTVGAAAEHAEAGLLQVTVATDPTTGGVYASFGTRADLIVAEPGAYVGFAGPRVVTSLGGATVEADVNRAEFALRHGLVDAVVPRPELRSWLARTLRSVDGERSVDSAPSTDPGHQAAQPTAWTQVQRARSPHRPRAAAYLEHFTDLTRLSGDRAGGTDDGVIVALGGLHGRPVGLIALDRKPVRPAGYRTAQRLLALADRLGLPVVTLVDTPGADPGSDSEAAGQAAAISATFAALLRVRSPTATLVIGEGGSGGALAFAVADRLILQEGSIFSVIAPEGAAAILHRDADRAPEVADLLQLTPDALARLGIADAVTTDDPAIALHQLSAQLDQLAAMPAVERLALRKRRYGAGS